MTTCFFELPRRGSAVDAADHARPGRGIVVDAAMTDAVQWPVWALAALLITTVCYAGRLVEGVRELGTRLDKGLADVRQGQADLKAALVGLDGRLEERFAAVLGELRELRAELRDDRENRAEVSKLHEGLTDVRVKVATIEAKR